MILLVVGEMAMGVGEWVGMVGWRVEDLGLDVRGLVLLCFMTDVVERLYELD